MNTRYGDVLPVPGRRAGIPHDRRDRVRLEHLPQLLAHFLCGLDELRFIMVNRILGIQQFLIVDPECRHRTFGRGSGYSQAKQRRSSHFDA